jgi:hypothetical protein
MSERRINRAAEALNASRVDLLEDYRVGSPFLCINAAMGSLFPYPTSAEQREAQYRALYADWVERFGAEIVDAVIDAMLDGSLVYQPGRVLWGRHWSAGDHRSASGNHSQTDDYEELEP